MTVDDAGPLAALLAAQRSDYLKDFYPFPFDAATIVELIANADRDRYWAIRNNGQIAGFFMLRGLDAGFVRPSFGIVVAEQFSGHGLARKSLAHALHWCREQNIEEVMLKVAHENAAARTIYEYAGFVCRGVCPDTRQLVYAKLLERN